MHFASIIRNYTKKIETNLDRPRLVCWLVSNCDTPSKREDFVHELQKHIEVDIYGKCGTAKCPHPLVKDCYNWLAERCKFYLSLENSNCLDYITEKLFYAMSSGMVPIVMSNTSNYSQLPAWSYISASDFASSKDLAEYLVRVGKDEKLYRSYHWWRTKYEVKDFAYMWLCDACQRLHETHASSTVKPLRSLASWWFDQSGCMS